MLMKSPEQLIPGERYHGVMDAPVRMKDGTTLPASELAERFFGSAFGRAMLDQPYRYAANFGYDRLAMLDDNGPDHCPIGHQRELPFHFGAILDREVLEGSALGSLTDEEQGILALAMFKHDNGESTHADLVVSGFTVVGDIPAGGKRDIDRENEAKIRAYFDEIFLNDVDPDVVARMEAIIAHKDNSVLHDYFEAAHAVQTFETSNRAHTRLMQDVWYRNGDAIPLAIDLESSARLSGLLGIARTVYEKSFSGLEEFRYFSYVNDFCDETKKLREPTHQLLN